MASSLCGGVDKAALRFTHKLKQMQRRLGLSRKELAENTGIAEKTVKGHLAGQRPCHDHLLAYFEYFGAELVNEWLAPIGITGAHPAEGETVCALSVIQHLTEATNIIAAAKADGFIDHKESAQIDIALGKLHVVVGQVKLGSME